MTESVKGVYSVSCKEKNNFKINIKAINGLLCLTIAVVGVYYLATINDLIVKSFVLQELKTRNSFLLEESRNLDNQAADIKSYKELTKRVEKLGMVSAVDIEYLKISNNSLASK